MVKRLSIIAALLFVAHVSTATDIAPILRWYVDAERLSRQDLQIRRGETVILEPTYRNYSAPIDLTSAHLVVMRYIPTTATDLSQYFVATGSVSVATGGVVQVRWDSTCESTNTAYNYEIAVQSTVSMLVRSYGKLTLLPGVANSGATSTVPTLVVSIDWATVEHSNLGSAPFLSDFNIADLEAFDATLGNGTADLRINSITSAVPYKGSASELFGFPSYLARTGDLTPNSITNVIKGEDRAVAEIERTGSNTVTIHFPIVGEGEIQTTNRLYWVVGGQAIGYVSSNGITMLRGSLQLFEEDLNCNVRAYDGSASAPSVSFYGSPANGWYRRSIGGGYGWGYANAGDAVACLYNSGWLLYGTRTYTGYGAELNYANVLTSYRVNSTNGLTTNINVIVSGGATQTLRFAGGILLP